MEFVNSKITNRYEAVCWLCEKQLPYSCNGNKSEDSQATQVEQNQSYNLIQLPSWHHTGKYKDYGQQVDMADTVAVTKNTVWETLSVTNGKKRGKFKDKYSNKSTNYRLMFYYNWGDC